MLTETLQVRLPFKIRLSLIALLTAALGFLCRFHQMDDALIYARYIANALNGLSLVFNAGEHVNALSSPFYSYIVLAVAKALHGNVLIAMALVSGSFFFLACSLAESLVPLAGLLLASTGYFYSLVGLESSAFLALLLLAAWALQHEKYEWLPTIAILLSLTRFEGASIIPVLAFELYRRRSPTLRSFAPAALIAVFYLSLNHHWYGTFLPTSAAAKLGQGRSGYWGRWPFAFFDGAYQLKPDFLPTLYIVALVALLAIPGFLLLKKSPLVRVGAPFLGILLAFYVLFNIPGYKWYFSPFIAFAMIYACAAVPRTFRWIAAAALTITLSAGTAIYKAATTPPPSPTMNYTGIGRWLAANTPPGTTVESAEIGTVAWNCLQCTVIDSLGLTTPKNADHIAHHDRQSWLAEDRPDYVVMHFQVGVLEAVAQHSPAYERVPVDFGPSAYLLHRKTPR